MRLSISIITIVLTTCFCVEIPSSLKKCSRKNSDFPQCIKEAIEDALHKSKSPVKEIGLTVMDPMLVPALVVAPGTGTVRFSQNFTNLNVFGLSDATCDKIEMNFDTKILSFDCHTPKARMEFLYEISGQLLVLPISGKGTGVINLDELRVTQVFTLEEYEKNGKKHYKVKTSKALLYPKFIKFRLDNLFNGDKLLGDNINQVLNDNWFEVFNDVKPSYEVVMGDVFGQIFDRVLAKVSIEELWGEK